ncbi:chromosome partition protein Smc-like [Erythrolamprus reginae]|uniref:chromosome partition protein Smc-like n=1 Tax=Erythrolamprus reginae TaxID=121349 RepID=UPI00396CB4D4
MSSTSTFTKTIKKQTLTSATSPQVSPQPSPVHQSTSASMLAKEKEKEKAQSQPTLQTIQETLNAMKDFTLKSQHDANQQREGLKAEIGELKEDTGEMKEKMKEIQQTLKESEQRIKAVEEKTEKVEQRMDDFEDRSDSLNKRYDESITHLEIQRASYGLRFQNITEEKYEDLQAKMAEIIGGILQVDPLELIKEIDEVFRVQTSYICRHNLPREVHIKFVRKTIRDDILKWTRNEKLQDKEKEITILKQVPRKVRESRRDYYFLTKILIKENITFRWLIAEGFSLYWKSQRVKIENLEDVRQFYETSGICKFEQSMK